MQKMLSGNIFWLEMSAILVFEIFLNDKMTVGSTGKAKSPSVAIIVNDRQNLAINSTVISKVSD